MSLIQGLPLLTADEHEFATSWYSTNPPEGSGWALIGCTALQEGPPPQKYDQGEVFFWARRKDGRPLGSLPRDYPRKQPPRRCEDD